MKLWTTHKIDNTLTLILILCRFWLLKWIFLINYEQHGWKDMNIRTNVLLCITCRKTWPCCMYICVNNSLVHEIQLCSYLLCQLKPLEMFVSNIVQQQWTGKHAEVNLCKLKSKLSTIKNTQHRLYFCKYIFNSLLPFNTIML